jgi:hypothetical protein
MMFVNSSLLILLLVTATWSTVYSQAQQSRGTNVQARDTLRHHHNNIMQRNLNPSKGGQKDETGSFKGLSQAEVTCLLFETYNKFDPPRGLICDEFDILDIFLCPDEDAGDVADICAQEDPESNNAVYQAYCKQLFATLSEERAGDCSQWCTNYVSRTRGDCCAWDCE